MEMPSEKTHTKNWLVLLSAFYVAYKNRLELFSRLFEESPA